MIININNPPLHAVAISRQGENEFREIVIDVSSWVAEYPDGKISVIYCRPDGELYPVIVNATESPIVWRPTAADTAVAGVGAIEVRIQIGDALGKSCTIAAKVLGALGAPGEAPAAPAPDWAQQVAEDAASAAAAAEKAEAASTHMPQISESKTWLVWDAEAGEYVDTGVSAAGEKGDDGKSAYAYAVEGGYTGTEAEFAAKLAEEMPEKLPNPNALTFTGEVSATYDGSAPMSVEIPSGGGSGGSGSMQETVLASGVVATGTAKWHKENTGLTVADLQEWKLWGFVCLASSQNTTFGINFGNSTVVKVASTGCKVILSWFDDDHNAINVVDLLTQDGFIKIDKSFFSVGYGGRASKGGLHGGYIPYVNNANDTVYIYTHDELAEDVAFKIVGLIK